MIRATATPRSFVCPFLWGWLAGAVAGCGSPLVGGECQSGYDICAGQCVALARDPQHCGACNRNCGMFACEDGECSDTVRGEDGAVPRADGAVVDGGGGGLSDGSVEDPADAATGPEGCGLGLTDCAGACVDTAADRAHCGGCSLRCGPAELCERGRCVQACSGGSQVCGGGCVDTLRDPRHCGGCNFACASGICGNGTCDDAVPGHLVVVGHSYKRSNRFQSTLLGNALFLGQGAPVRTLVYAGTADPASVSGVHNAIDMVAGSIGRAWAQTEAVASEVTAQLAAADVFLIHAQTTVSDSQLGGLGAIWGTAIVEFLKRGGVVVLIEGASTDNGGTFQVLRSSGLFRATSRTPLIGQELVVVEPGSGIALRVGARYRGEADTVVFVGIDTPGVPVSEYNGTPVVFQRVMR